MRRSRDPEAVPGVSRRSFLKGMGASALAAGAIAPALPARSAPEADALQHGKGPGAKLLGPDPVAMTLNINGKERKVTLEPRVTLVDALRNHLDLTGAKKVCDRATCGACTVLLDGKGVYSCTVLAIEAQGRKIETVEGLAEGAAKEGGMAKVQRCFVENDAQQCGFAAVAGGRSGGFCMRFSSTAYRWIVALAPPMAQASTRIRLEIASYRR